MQNRRKILKVLLACVLLSFAISSAAASCFMRQAKSVKHQWSDEWIYYCEYNGIKVMEGSKFTDADNCMRCSCTRGHFMCCGIGYKAGVFNVPGCKVVQDLCSAVVLNTAGTALCHQ